MRPMKSAAFACLFVFSSCVAVAGQPAREQLRAQVEDTERAFADTMAERDFEAFKSFLSPEAIFFASKTPLRGAQQVAAAWEAYFQGPQAPFSWQPETVVVLDSGSLALSSGPVRDPEGKIVATFNSVWRRESGGEWKIVFDKGDRACDCVAPGGGAEAD